MGCATGLVKGLMATFNFMFVLVGIGLISIGTYIYLGVNNYDELITPAFLVAPTLVIILGIIIFLIAFFGCCGVIRESHCMLVTYAVFLLVIFFIQLAIGVYTYLQVDKTGQIQPVIKSSLEKGFESYNVNKDAREAMNFVQEQFKCCGVDGPDDYKSKWQNSSVPASCCVEYTGQPCKLDVANALLPSIISSVVPAVTYYRVGCAQRLSQFLTDKAEIVFYVCIGVAVVEILGALFAFCLASSVKNESRRRYA